MSAEQQTALHRSWHAASIDVNRILREIGLLWGEWSRQFGIDVGGNGRMDLEPAYMRPSTVNVVAVTETAAEAASLATILATLPEYTPSRSIILARSEPDGGSSEPFGIEITIDERRASQTGSPTRVEVLTITAPQGHDEVLASIITPLLVADLPDVLYVPRDPVANNPLVAMLSEDCDGLLVDSVATRQAGSLLALLSEACRARPRLGVGDLVWTRLRTFRDLVAQFFDTPSALALLDRVDTVTIQYAPEDPDGRRGLTAGLLMAGWLATRLGWRAPGDLIPTGVGYRLTLRAGERGRSREVLLTVQAGHSARSCSSLERVELSSENGSVCSFVVERADEQAISTSSRSQLVPAATRVVHAGCPSDRVILAAKLRRLRNDPIYAEAVQFASELWPEGYDS